MLIDWGDFVVVVVVMLEPAITKRVKATKCAAVAGQGDISNVVSQE